MIHILDNALDNAAAYRVAALSTTFRSYAFEHCVFHGIGVGEATGGLLGRIHELLPSLVPTLTFFRKSPAGQIEPHFIHTDADMGEWSAILYLNEKPPEGDGTSFWIHGQTGAIGSDIPHERSIEGRTTEGWELRMHVPARFNRLLLFPSVYFHSRSLYENWGEGNEARLTQVAFGTGCLNRGPQ